MVGDASVVGMEMNRIVGLFFQVEVDSRCAGRLWIGCHVEFFGGRFLKLSMREDGRAEKHKNGYEVSWKLPHYFRPGWRGEVSLTAALQVFGSWTSTTAIPYLGIGKGGTWLPIPQETA
jgi:hypothetical protein